MIDYWKQIKGSHVVKIFRDVTHDWWDIDVHFYDKNGNCKDNDIPFRNQLCSLMQSKEKTKKDCHQFRIENLKGLNKSHKTFFCKNCENLLAVAVPLVVSGSHYGSMVCSGIQLPIDNDQKEKSIIKLTKLGYDKIQVGQCYDKIKVASSHTEEYVLKLMKRVAGDITLYCENMFQEKERKKLQTLLEDLKYNEKYINLIGRSKPLKKVLGKLELIENSESPVLIQGETGTGKELIASAIHYNSVRRDKPFVIQNCSAFSDTILSSELFGHEKGSFTGAVSEKKGLFEIADGGTLFLDEIGDISMEIQGKLLRVLENGTFYRVGGTEEREIDVRIITATNKDLSKMVEEGLFRKDLLYRINTLHIDLPPLRERRDDIMPLFYFFLKHYSDRRRIGIKELNSDIIEMLKNHNWPGNVRELKNVVENLVTMSSKSKTIEPEHIPNELKPVNNTRLSVVDESGSKTLRDTIADIEEEITRKVLQRLEWNKSASARELGISRASLNRRIEKYNIRKESH